MPATVVDYQYTTRGACCRRIIVSLNEGVIQDIQFIGGCDGNHRGLRALVRSRAATEVIALLKGTPCDGGAGSSCPDQLASALEAALR